MNKNLLLGIGNEILTDDGIGPKLIALFQENLSLPETDFASASLGGLEILEFIQGYEKVIFIDAIMTKGGIPGTVYSFSVSDFRETLHLSNIHDISFLTALKFGKSLGFTIPDSIRIIAIEILEDRVFSTNFTPILEEKFPEITREVEKQIREFLN